MSCQILQGDCLESLRCLPSESVHCVVTSPPYWGLRDYGVDGQIGLESTVDAMIRDNRPLEEIIVLLVSEKRTLSKELLRLDSIAPKKVKTPDGKIFVWHCPDDLIPEVKL